MICSEYPSDYSEDIQTESQIQYNTIREILDSGDYTIDDFLNMEIVECYGLNIDAWYDDTLEPYKMIGFESKDDVYKIIDKKILLCIRIVDMKVDVCEFTDEPFRMKHGLMIFLSGCLVK